MAGAVHALALDAAARAWGNLAAALLLAVAATWLGCTAINLLTTRKAR
ncbi:hypothetical protein ACGFIR_24810 [Micromonospora sp. NPDC049051]